MSDMAVYRSKLIDELREKERELSDINESDDFDLFEKYYYELKSQINDLEREYLDLGGDPGYLSF